MCFTSVIHSVTLEQQWNKIENRDDKHEIGISSNERIGNFYLGGHARQVMAP